jgi:hypothetical protein
MQPETKEEKGKTRAPKQHCLSWEINKGIGSIGETFGFTLLLLQTTIIIIFFFERSKQPSSSWAGKAAAQINDRSGKTLKGRATLLGDEGGHDLRW